MRHAWRSVWVFLPLVMLVAAPAYGQVRLLVVEPQSAFVPKKQLAGLKKALVAQAADYRNIGLVEAAGFVELRKKAGCKGVGNKCLKAVGKAAGATQVLFTQVQKLPGRQLVVMRLVDVKTGRQLKNARLSARKGVAALRGSMRKGWMRMFGRLVACQIRVLSNVVGPDVSLDGRPVGKVPLTIREKLPPGKHTVSLSHPNYLPAERKITVKPKRPRMKVRINLKPVVVAKPGPAPSGEDIRPVALVTGKSLDDFPDLPGIEDPEPEEDKPEGMKTAEEPAEDKPEGIKTDDGKIEKIERPGPVVAIKPDVTPTAPVEDKPFLPGGGDTGRAGPEPPPPVPEPSSPVYEKWWFWTAVGAVAVAGVVTGTVLGLSGEEEQGIPSGKGRVTIQF